ncbi:MAG: molybdopterin-guanine dinucleotide biosynthesis protein MobB [Clostridiales bacterium]|nr:molybdopterin-guanine dinucleotide biosynthesis protein MobB [Clostridiales bacterium]
MKVFSVCGISKSGKTTTIERIICELLARGYRVGSVKEIHFEAFAIDPDPASNTNRHSRAGAGLVCARGLTETSLLFPEQLPMGKILSFYEGAYDWVVLEGVSDIPIPTIVTAHGEEDLREKLSDMTFCVSGRIADEIQEYHGLPAFSAVENIAALVDLIERRVYDRLPDFEPECCGACGLACAELGRAILAGQRKRSDCVADRGVALTVNGKRVDMVPFVQKILKNAVLGVAQELNGYESGCEIEVRF